MDKRGVISEGDTPVVKQPDQKKAVEKSAAERLDDLEDHPTKRLADRAKEARDSKTA